MSTAQHPVVHLELHTADVPAASAFYAALCGWPAERVETAAGSYVALDLGRRLGGGLVPAPAPRPLWLPYVEVPDVAAAAERAARLGAATLVPPREGPLGWRSVVRAPGAGELALWQPKR